MKNPRLKFAGIPRRFADAQLSDFEADHPEIVKVVSEWLYDPAAWSCKELGEHGKLWRDQLWRCLVINGYVGTGKTRLACAIAAEYCKRLNAHYTTAYAMSRRIMADKNADFYNKNPLLLIDEINRTFDTKAEQDRFFDLINYRYENEMPVVFIGNFAKEDLRQSIGEAVADRIGENLTFVSFAGESRRAPQ